MSTWYIPNSGLDCFTTSGGAACVSAYTRVCVIYIPPSLKKRDNSVGSVGNVGKSEKSPENTFRKVFQNAYTTYIP